MRILLICLFSLFLTTSSWAQERISNVRLRVADSSRLEVLYDLLSMRQGDSIALEIRSRQRGMLRIMPEYVRGDIGRRVSPGASRRIIWDVLANGYTLDEEIQAGVYIRPQPSRQPTADTEPEQPVATRRSSRTKTQDPATPAPAEPVQATPQPRSEPVTTTPEPNQSQATPVPLETQSVRVRRVGPGWALLSAVAPGVGNIFVQTPKPRIGFRPLVAASFYGLLAYGLVQRQESREAYARYEQQSNTSEAEPYYDQANQLHHRYYLATRAAAAIWLTDVVLTTLRGIRNNRSQGVSLRPGWQAGQPTAVVRYSF